MMLSLDTAYRSFGGEVEASSTPTICRLSDSHRHQLSAIALLLKVFGIGPGKQNSRLSACNFMTGYILATDAWLMTLMQPSSGMLISPRGATISETAVHRAHLTLILSS